MHFDDRLATVLRLPASADGFARVQFRQLVDILGQTSARESTEILDAGFARLEELSSRIGSADRARLLRQTLQPIENPRLLAWLVEAEPDVASAAIGVARLDDAAWLELIPLLPVRARGILRHRRDLSSSVEALLARLGVRDRGLPAGPVDQEPDPEAQIPEVPRPRFKAPTGDLAIDQDISDDVLELLDMGGDPPPPTSLSEWAKARAAQHKDLAQRTATRATAHAPDDLGIGAIVRRIEEFRRAREAARAAELTADSPQLPSGEGAASTQRLAMAIDFTTDPLGRIDWADGPWAPSVTGLNLAKVPTSTSDESGVARPDLEETIRRRLPLRGARITVRGAPAVTGPWQIDAIPRFEHGRFIGYCGRMRRPASPVQVDTAPDPVSADADRMREVLHELRTPANAIQVAAEIIQQQLYGPAPHEYRALAAAIAGDCAHILAGFEELDRLVKLETGAQVLDEGECDLARVLAQTVLRLRAWTEPRGSSFALSSDPSATSLPVRVARTDVERLVWRLLAAMAGMTAPGEALSLSWALRGVMVELTVQLPAVLAAREPSALFDALPGEMGKSLAAGMFGVGFTLRLATAEAAATGGQLRRIDDSLFLSLPALTGHDAGHSNATARSL